MPSRDTQSSTVSHIAPEDIQLIEECIERLKSIPTPSADKIRYVSDVERDVDAITRTMNFYQEQPHVLDPHLQAWIDKLLPLTLSDSISQTGFNLAFHYLYLITKVRGYKYIVRLLPHEVSDIEVVLRLLESERTATWHARYILFLWLSILVLIPFDLKRLDGDKDPGYTVRRMLGIAFERLQGSDISSGAAALVIAKLVTRPDLYKQYLRRTIDDILNRCKAAEKDPFFGAKKKLGVLECLARIFKIGRREYIRENSEYVLKELIDLGLRHEVNTLLRRYESKLVQRIGLSFLVPRVAKWRYQRGTRILADSFGTNSGSITDNTNLNIDKRNKEEEEEDYDIPDEIEDVLDILFRCLKDPETIVRWNAAKGIGRITARLPYSLATDIVTTLLESFTPLESCDSWHGGCLALAELGRYGYLHPEHLPQVVPILIKALQYDEKRGNIILGSNVRDAACYLSWSFARTYDPEQIKPFVNEIANALILTTLFDRCINCRRAASAAFQENVGRQGSFPYGIDILTTCDYYSVALQSSTYHKLSVNVATFEPYRKSIIDYLGNNRSLHWCSSIRQDSSVALKNLCRLSPEYISSAILDKFLSVIDNGDFNGRIGALLSISNICVGLLECNKLSLLSDGQIKRINSVVNVIESAGLFKGSGGDEIRAAVCCYIERISVAGVQLEEDTITKWQLQLDVDLVNPEQQFGVQQSAVKALERFSAQYYTCRNATVWQGIARNYLSQLDHEFTATRVGSAYALGVLPGCVLEPHLDVLIPELGNKTKVLKKCDLSLAECRVSAVKGLTNVFVKCSLNAQQRLQVYQILLECLEDYSTDSRGDIGSFVREAGMQAIRHVNVSLLSREPHIISTTLTRELKVQLVCGLVQQSVEKIDRTRQIAITTLHGLVHAADLELEHHDVLKTVVPPLREKASDGQLLDNSEYFKANTVFSRFLKLITCPVYVNSLIRGIVVTLGGLTESLVKASSEAYVDALTENESWHSVVLDGIIDVMGRDHKNDRVIVPLFKTVDLTLTNIMLDEDLGNKFVGQFVALAKKEISKCGNVPKLLSVIPPLSNCLQFPESKPALSQIMLLLCHRYPRVRKGMADAFYTSLVSYEDLFPDCEKVMEIVESTVWENPDNMEELRAGRNTICEMLGLPVPKLVAGAKAQNRPKPSTEQFDSYGDLVNRVGY